MKYGKLEEQKKLTFQYYILEKTYEDLETEKHHMEAFIENIKKIDHHNKLHEMGRTAFTLGINKYSDLVSIQTYKR